MFLKYSSLFSELTVKKSEHFAIVRNRDPCHPTPLRGCLATGSTNKNNDAEHTAGRAIQGGRCLSQMSSLNAIEGHVWKVFSSPPWVLEIVKVEGEGNTDQDTDHFRKDL